MSNIVDKGPWAPYASEDGKLGVMSDDFTHDVFLIVTGDFEDEFQRANYCQWLADALNKATTVQPTGVTNA